MKVITKNSEEAMSLVKRMVYLAYNACGGAFGMGMFQEARLGGNKASEDQVWKCAYDMEDYAMRHGAKNEVYCDYVFGSMMKWGCRWDDNTITIRENEFRSDYQSFCRTYPNNKALVEAAIKSLDLKDVVIQS